jgi:hypothetical protein
MDAPSIKGSRRRLLLISIVIDLTLTLSYEEREKSPPLGEI